MKSRAKHVGIIEAVDALVSGNILHIADTLHKSFTVASTSPAVAHVLRDTPAASASLSAPFPRFALAPFTDVEHRSITSLFKGISHRAVANESRVTLRGCVAIVTLHNVDFPTGVGIGIDLLFTIRAEGTGTGVFSSIGVNAEAHPLSVYIVRHWCEPVGETFRIWQRFSVSGTALGMPPVVHHHGVPSVVC